MKIKLIKSEEWERLEITNDEGKTTVMENHSLSAENVLLALNANGLKDVKIEWQEEEE